MDPGAAGLAGIPYNQPQMAPLPKPATAIL